MGIIKVTKQDIAAVKVDIIVNAAESSLLGGGGVDGRIHYMAGPELRRECATLGGCRDGEAKMTDAYKLPCKKVIHTVGPVYYGGKNNEKEILAKCYINCMKLAEEYREQNKLETLTIAFPCISTGAFGYPKEEACKIAIDSVLRCNYTKIDVMFVCFEELDYQLYNDRLKKIESIEIHRSGNILRALIRSFKENPNKDMFVSLCRCLNDSIFLYVPMNLIMSEKDQETFKNSKVGETVQSSDYIRMRPDWLKNGEKLYFPVFTSIEEATEEYSQSFSWSNLTIDNCINFIDGNKECNGMVIDAFSNQLVIEGELYESMKWIIELIGKIKKDEH